jgi:hypothetical protein
VSVVPEPQDADQDVVDPDVDVADPVERREVAGPRLHAVLGAIAVGGVVGAEARYGLGVCCRTVRTSGPGRRC